ncbi:hypothetical protein SNE40_018706 [Patella caerulea]|uniref:Uncharacterized protein n=1 Tax=Patella caerulea TaxID=87958 RepID=A0AAN8P8E7_PATCE
MAASIKRERTGYEEGFLAGCESGKLEGCMLGIEKGGNIGSELGFYHGYALELKRILEKDAGLSKPRTKKTMDSLNTMIENFALEDALNQTLFEELETIRAKFKQLTTQLNVSVQYGSVDTVKGASF